MTEVLSAESIIVNLSGQIDFEWIAGQEDSDLPSHTISSSQHATLVGHLNLVHKNLIQVIGATECEYLQGLEESFRNNMLDEIFSANPAAIIMADGIPVPDMSDEQLRDWVDACRKMELYVKPAKARRSWKRSGQQAVAEIERRAARRARHRQTF